MTPGEFYFPANSQRSFYPALRRHVTWGLGFTINFCNVVKEGRAMNAQRILGFLILMLWCVNTTGLADVVTEWNLAALDAIRARSTPPPAASRHLAILHTAIYDAVNGIRRTHTPVKITGNVPASASVESAAVAAAHTVLLNLYPTLQPSFDELESRLLAGISNGPQKMHGVRWGESVAAGILEWRSADGASQIVDYTPGTQPGQWRPTLSFGGIVRPALAPHWGEVAPFALARGSQFRPPAPPALGSADTRSKSTQ